MTMKCDNKECDKEAVYSATSKVWGFHINVCPTHLKDLRDNSGMEFDVLAKIP